MFGTDLLAPTHILLILVVALLVLGPKRLPEVGRSLGRGLRDFRQGIQGVQDEARGMFSDALDEPTPTQPDVLPPAPEELAPFPAQEPTMVAAENLPPVPAEPFSPPAPAPPAAAEPIKPHAKIRVPPAEHDPADYAD